MASTYLTRTPSSAGNRKTFTWSGWIKRGNLSYDQSILFSAAQSMTGGNKATSDVRFGFNSSDEIGFDVSGFGNLNSSAKFRDVSAWYHVVMVLDTTQGSESDRYKLYVNGTEQSTTGGLTINQDDEFAVNNNVIQYLGFFYRNSYYFDGSMAHVHFIDGTAYDASAFGQTDATTGIWKPKLAPSVTYGTNGYFLKFASSGSMGTDSSGNGNDFTISGNLTQTQDTPSNVFCTLNPLSVATNHTLTNANLTSTNSSSSQGGVNGTLNYPTSGKWYHEVKINAEDSSKGQGVGIGDNVYRSDWGTYSNFVGYLSDGTITAQGDAGYTSYGTAQNVGDIIGVAYNADDQELTFYLNGTSQGVISTSSMDGTIDFDNLCPLAFGRNMGQSFNFGNGYFGTTAVSSANSDGDGIGLFEYEVPSGYYALCTKNINTYG